MRREMTRLTMRGWLLFLLVAMSAALTAPAQAQSSRGRGAYDRDVTAEQARTWERIPLTYIDARIVAAILGAPVVPTEGQLYTGMFGGGMGGFGQQGGVFGGGSGGLGGQFGGPGGFGAGSA